MARLSSAITSPFDPQLHCQRRHEHRTVTVQRARLVVPIVFIKIVDQETGRRLATNLILERMASESAEAFIYIAMTRIMLRRIA